jgi:hypothetical protein
MTKKVKIEIEITMTEEAEHRVIQIARKHYCVPGKTRTPVGKCHGFRRFPPEEFIPNAASALIELIGSNELLADAGVEVTAVSGCYLPQKALPQREAEEAEVAEHTSVRTQPLGIGEADLGEFETGVYLCRWPNGDFSLVRANTRREALVELDEWGAAHPCQLFPIDSCMVDFRLNDQGEIELNQFGEDTEELIWEISYPKLHAHLLSVMSTDGGKQSSKVKTSIRRAVQHERERLWMNQPTHPQAETEVGKTLQKQLRITGPVADHYVQRIAHRLLSSIDDKSEQPN